MTGPFSIKAWSLEEAEDDEDTSISLSKGDMTFTVSGDEGDDTRAIVSWGNF